MIMQFFTITPQTTFENLRKQYIKLSKNYHPDMPNGNTEIFKRIGLEYSEAQIQLKNREKVQSPNPILKPNDVLLTIATEIFLIDTETIDVLTKLFTKIQNKR